jgi:bifunctional enzyme CysN/CysC
VARSLVKEMEFVEVFVDTRLEIAESRDPKGLYAKAPKGELKNFTAIDSPYETPANADLIINTEFINLNKAAEYFVQRLNFRI